MRAIVLAMLALGFVLQAAPSRADLIAYGAAQQNVQLRDTVFTIYTYRPQCQNPSLLVVVHGLGRNADGYRTYAQPIADQACMLVVAPLFDEERFPGWRFQRGGIERKGRIQDQSRWTGHYIFALIDWARRMERRPLTVSIIGHSAGGQFLSRFAAFMPSDAKRIVIANPSTHVFPTLDTDAPFGMRGVYPRGRDESALRRYLATPVTIFLGIEDTGDENRNDSDEAKAQGVTRHERGRNAFTAGRRIAQKYGWAFNWRLVELPGVGHSARKMLGSKQALEALSP